MTSSKCWLVIKANRADRTSKPGDGVLDMIYGWKGQLLERTTDAQTFSIEICIKLSGTQKQLKSMRENDIGLVCLFVSWFVCLVS